MRYVYMSSDLKTPDMELSHHGIKGQKWGVRRYQNPDGSLTDAGKERYNKMSKAVVLAANGKEAHDKGRITSNRHDAYIRNVLIKDYDEGIKTLTKYTGSKEQSRKMIDDFVNEKKKLAIGDILKDYGDTRYKSALNIDPQYQKALDTYDAYSNGQKMSSKQRYEVARKLEEMGDDLRDMYSDPEVAKGIYRRAEKMAPSKR